MTRRKNYKPRPAGTSSATGEPVTESVRGEITGLRFGKNDDTGHREMMAKYGWVFPTFHPGQIIPTKRVLIALSNGFEGWAHADRAYKNGAVRVIFEDDKRNPKPHHNYQEGSVWVALGTTSAMQCCLCAVSLTDDEHVVDVDDGGNRGIYLAESAVQPVCAECASSVLRAVVARVRS